MKNIIQIRDFQNKPPQGAPRRKPQVLTTKVLPNTKKTVDETWDFLVKKGVLDDNILEVRNYQMVNNAWLDEPCYVIGSGPPLRDVLSAVGWNFFRGRHTIGINHTIEDFDEFEWFFFLDQRFLDKTTYNLKKFRGRIFAQCTTQMKTSKRVTIFHTAKSPSTRMEDGLYNGNLSGLAALNLAIISGANPIYLIGFGMGAGASPESYHYKADYTAETKTQDRFEKFRRVHQNQFQPFAPYAGRVVHVTPGSDIPVFKKMSIPEFEKRHRGVPPARRPRVIHLSLSGNIDVHGDVTRYIVRECIGSHAIVNINGPIPPADLYVLEHFLATDRQQMNLSGEIKKKTIAIVHTMKCYPQGYRRVVSLTEAWRKHIVGKGIQSTLVRGGIDLVDYEDAQPDYAGKKFGRMTRWSPGKIHPEWNRVTMEILNAVEGSRCIFFVDKKNLGGRPMLNFPRMLYVDECKIHMNKAPFLKRLSVYVHASGTFKETMSHSCIEAMACGLPVVYLSEGTGVLEEVVGEGGVRCKNIEQVKQAIISLLRDPQACRQIGERGRERAKMWDKNRMVAEFDKVLREEWKEEK